MKDNLLDGEYLITKDYTDWMVKTGGFARDMTLRDHFAGLAMQSLIANIEAGKENQIALVFNTAYEIAAAMLEERTK
jgi:hypothetical protein